MNINKYLPTYVHQTIENIDFNQLYANDKRIILFDLDNTLARYQDYRPNESIVKFFNKLSIMGFKLYIISNNTSKRVIEFSRSLPINGFLVRANKPKIKMTEQYLKRNLNNQYDKNQIIVIGDQILTDIAFANKFHVDSVLVKTIDIKTEKWYTKVNKLRLLIIMPQIKRLDRNLYDEIRKLR